MTGWDVRMEPHALLGSTSFRMFCIAMGFGERLGQGLVLDPVELHRNPYACYERLREQHPLHWSSVARAWVVTRYEDVHALLRDGRLSSDLRDRHDFSNLRRKRLREGYTEDELDRPSILVSEGGRHTRLRRPISGRLSPARVRALRSHIEKAANELLDVLASRKQFDLATDFAARLPVRILARLIGLEDVREARLHHWASALSRTLGLASGQEIRESRQAASEIRDEMIRQIAARERRPREDLLTELIQYHGTVGPALHDVTTTCQFLIGAGTETTAALIANAMLALFQHPDQLATLVENPGEAPRAVDELVRFDSPVQMVYRASRESFCLRDKEIRTGTPVLLVLASANRDSQRFPHADLLDVRRSTSHLGFGSGRHACVGASLARAEVECALEALLRRLPRLEWAGPATRFSNLVVRRVVSLPVRIGG